MHICRHREGRLIKQKRQRVKCLTAVYILNKVFKSLKMRRTAHQMFLRCFHA